MYNAEGPIKLFEPDVTKTRLLAVRQGIDLLRSYPGPVALVFAIGKARSGKSFTLNHLLEINHTIGFHVGHTFVPETVGASIWPEPLGGHKRTADNVSVLLVDTEGLDIGLKTYDKALLLIAATVASGLMYHNMEYVYTDDVSRLFSITCLIEHYKRNGIIDTSDLPKLIWVVQKYALSPGSDGMTPEMMLRDVLLREIPNPSNIQDIAKFNATAKVVRTEFKNQSIYLIPSAVPVSRTGIELTEIPQSSLSADYLAEMDRLRIDITETTVAKRLRGSKSDTTSKGTTSTTTRDVRDAPLTGPEMANLILSVMDAANENIEYIGDKVLDTIIQRCSDDSKRDMRRYVDEFIYPVDENVLRSFLAQKETILVEEFIASVPVPVSDRVSQSGANVYAVEGTVSELKRFFSDEGTRASMLNNIESEKVCNKEEDDAVGEVRRMMPSIHSDVAKFDIVSEHAIETYEKKSRGPGYSSHRASLVQRISDLRKTIEANGIPMKRMRWISSAAIVLVISFFASKITPRIRGTIGVIVDLSVATCMVVSFGVITVTAWSMFRTCPIEFEDLEHWESWIELWLRKKTIYFVVILCGFATIRMFIGRFSSSLSLITTRETIKSMVQRAVESGQKNCFIYSEVSSDVGSTRIAAIASWISMNMQDLMVCVIGHHTHPTHPNVAFIDICAVCSINNSSTASSAVASCIRAIDGMAGDGQTSIPIHTTNGDTYSVASSIRFFVPVVKLHDIASWVNRR